MKTWRIFLILSLFSIFTSGYASEDCTLEMWAVVIQGNAERTIPLNELQSYKEKEVDRLRLKSRVVQTNSWEECYQEGVNEARRHYGKVFYENFKLILPGVAQDQPAITVTNYFYDLYYVIWEYNDTIFNDSDGHVSSFSYLNYPAKGDQRVEDTQGLFEKLDNVEKYCANLEGAERASTTEFLQENGNKVKRPLPVDFLPHNEIKCGREGARFWP